MGRARKRLRWPLLAGGAVVLVAALLWRPAVSPLLVKFPTDLDQVTRYEGTFTLHVDQATGAPLPAPVEAPLALERRIRTVPGESGARTVVLQELVTYRIAGTEQREAHQYVMDRRTMANRDDRRSWSYDPGNVVDRAGTYRVNLPLDADREGRYRIWENEPGAAFAMVGLDRGQELHGLGLVEMEEVFDRVPVADVYREELRKQGFPLAVGFDVLAARLQASGVDVDRALAALPAAHAATVAEARAASLPLRFFRSNDGHALVEPRTGAIVDLLRSDEGISATVDLSSLATLRRALAAISNGPEVGRLAGALDDLESHAPWPVYDLSYRQTPASVAEIVRLTQDEVSKLELVERRIPWGLLAAGTVLVLAGVALRPRRRVASGRPPGAGLAPWSVNAGRRPGTVVHL